MNDQKNEPGRQRGGLWRGVGGLSPAWWGVAALIQVGLTVVAFSEEKPFDLFPTGKPWRDVRIPRYDGDDVLTSMMHTEAMTRQDEKELKLDGLTLVMFQSSGEISLRLKTKQGLYDVGASMLRTHSTTFIEHAQFEMKGNRMRFDTAKQQGTLEGNVEMLIYGVPVPATVPAAAPPRAAPAVPALPEQPAGGEQRDSDLPKVEPSVEVVQVASPARLLSNPKRNP